MNVFVIRAGPVNRVTNVFNYRVVIMDTVIIPPMLVFVIKAGGEGFVMSLFVYPAVTLTMLNVQK